MVAGIETPLIGADYWFDKLNIKDFIGNPLRPGDSILVPKSQSHQWGLLHKYKILRIRVPYDSEPPTQVYIEYDWSGGTVSVVYEISYLSQVIKIK